MHNAIQAMDNKGTLTIEIKKKDKFISISFTDTGEGIPAEIIDKIFNPFFTTKAIGQGSGLGLNIVRKIIEKHEGKISAQSKPGKTCFNVLLPI